MATGFGLLCRLMWISAIAKVLAEHRFLIGQAAAVGLTVVLYIVSFPPFDYPEGGFLLLIPFLLWLRLKPTYRQVAWASLAAGWIAWFVLIIWLRYVTWLGTILLSGIVGAHFMLWCLGTSWLSRWLSGKGPWLGVPYAVGAAALWVVIEHIRGWIFTGFQINTIFY